MTLDELSRLLRSQARAGTGTLVEPGFADAAWANLQARWQRSLRRPRGSAKELEAAAAARWLVQHGLPFRLPHWSHFVAKVLFAVPSPDAGDIAVASRPDRVELLLRSWQADLDTGRFSRLTWFHAFKAWMSVDPDADDVDDDTRASHAMTGQFLRRTFDRAVLAVRTDGRPRAHPAWAMAIRTHPEILSQRVPAGIVEALARGDREPAGRLADALQLPAAGWFWTRMVRDVVTGLARQDDSTWHASLDALASLLEWDRARPLRDRLVAVVVERTAGMATPRVHRVVRDWACSAAVWGPPPSEDLAASTPWRLVSAHARAVVRAWRAEQLLEMFFRVAMRRNAAMGNQRHGAVDSQRFEFWRRYVGQVTAWRLVLGGDSQRSNETELMKIRKEEGANVARLDTGDSSLDAFMLRIGPLLVVEFSRMGHASYVYETRARRIPSMTGRAFDLPGLKIPKPHHIHRIVHRDGWMTDAFGFLRDHGILPDAMARPRSGAATAGVDWDRATRRQSTVPAPGVSGTAGRQDGRLGQDAVERLQEVVERFGGFFRKQPAGTGRPEMRYFPDAEPDAAASELLALLGFEADDGGLYWRRRG